MTLHETDVRLLLVTSGDAHGLYPEYTFGWGALSTEQIHGYLAAMERVARLDEETGTRHEVSEGDSLPQFFSSPSEEDSEFSLLCQEADDQGETLVCPVHLAVPDSLGRESQPLYQSELVLSAEGLYWRGYPHKHTMTLLETSLITREMLRSAMGARSETPRV